MGGSFSLALTLGYLNQKRKNLADLRYSLGRQVTNQYRIHPQRRGWPLDQLGYFSPRVKVLSFPLTAWYIHIISVFCPFLLTSPGLAPSETSLRNKEAWHQLAGHQFSLMPWHREIPGYSLRVRKWCNLWMDSADQVRAPRGDWGPLDQVHALVPHLSWQRCPRCGPH